MKDHTHSLIMALLSNRKSHLPERKHKTVTLRVKDMREHVLLACRSRLAIINILHSLYMFCAATSPVEWPRYAP